MSLAPRSQYLMLIPAFLSSHPSYAGITLLDADGDGQLNADDLAIYWKQAKDILVHAVPSSAGFASGMALGIFYA